MPLFSRALSDPGHLDKAQRVLVDQARSLHHQDDDTLIRIDHVYEAGTSPNFPQTFVVCMRPGKQLLNTFWTKTDKISPRLPDIIGIPHHGHHHEPHQQLRR